MTHAKPIRVVLAKVGLDGHDRGIKIVARGLRDGGCHVIYGGLWQSPEAVVRTVADEDAQWLGLSILSGAHLTLVPRVMRALVEGQLQHVGVVIGGIIPAEDFPALLELGVAKVFGPGTTLTEIVAFVHSASRGPRAQSSPLDKALQVPATIPERLALSRLISLASDGEQEAALRQAVAARIRDMPRNRSPIIALTGSAGVGKSTLIGKLLITLRSRQRSAAVLACDPASSLTGGALLGDRVRMAAAVDDGVFIRSLPAPAGRQALADNLPLILELTSAAGFDCVLLETAGAGQGDTAVRDLATLVVVLVQPEAGDELQWEKAGLLEVADVVVVHKADLSGADRVTGQLRDLLNLPGSREIPVVAVSSSRGHGVDTLWDAIEAALARRGAARDGAGGDFSSSGK